MVEEGHHLGRVVVVAVFQSAGVLGRQRLAVGLQIDPATTIPEKSFQQPMANNYAHALGPFNEQNQAWMNSHYIVFRAEGQSARLTLSDWARAREAGGPPTQELIYNFVEVQPYLDL